MNETNFKKKAYEIGLTLEAKACKTLLLMYGISDDEGNVATSLTDLHERSDMAISTIRSALKELEEKGVLKITPKVGLDSEYKLLLINKV